MGRNTRKLAMISLGKDVTPALGFILVVLGVLLLLLSVILGYASHWCVKQSVVGNGFAIALAIIAGLGTYFVLYQSVDTSGEITLHNKLEAATDEEIEQVEKLAYQYIYLRKNSQNKIKMLNMNEDLSEEEWKYIGEVVEINQELTDALNKQFSDKLKTDSKLKETWEEIQEKLLEV